jgi:hypothetical protein
MLHDRMAPTENVRSAVGASLRCRLTASKSASLGVRWATAFTASAQFKADNWHPSPGRRAVPLRVLHPCAASEGLATLSHLISSGVQSEESWGDRSADSAPGCCACYNWPRGIARCGLGDLHVHDLRHTTGMRLRQVGVPESTRADIHWPTSRSAAWD